MPYVPGLRSPYAKVGRLVYFGRMLDKIRLHAADRLPKEYHDNLGEPRPALFDARCCRFLGVSYADLRQRTLAGGSCTDVLNWVESNGTPHTDEECNVWNRFMMKIGWRDDRSAVLQQRIQEANLTDKAIETFFDLIEYDEGRDPLRRRPWAFRPAKVVLLMGVSGSGKSTIGRQLATELGWDFRDADDFHPPANIAKLSAGIPLTDDGRAPWLDSIRNYINLCERDGMDAIVTCSALKEKYRAVLITEPSQIQLVYLKGSRELIAQRLASRVGHFMSPDLLDSQLAALEEPASAYTVDIAHSPDQIVASLRERFSV